MYPGAEFGATAAAAHGHTPPGQVAAWDPTMQAGRSTYVSAPVTLPGQNFATSSVPAYASTAMPAGSSPLAQTGPIASGATSTILSQPGVPPNVQFGGASPPGVRPGGVSPPGQSPYYGQ